MNFVQAKNSVPHKGCRKARKPTSMSLKLPLSQLAVFHSAGMILVLQYSQGELLCGGKFGYVSGAYQNASIPRKSYPFAAQNEVTYEHIQQGASIPQKSYSLCGHRRRKTLLKVLQYHEIVTPFAAEEAENKDTAEGGFNTAKSYLFAASFYWFRTLRYYRASIPRKGNPLCGGLWHFEMEDDAELQYRERVTLFAAANKVKQQVFFTTLQYRKRVTPFAASVSW